MQVARVGFLKKQDNPVSIFIRNTSCSSGWLRIAVQILFGTLIVISFILIVIMALGTPRHRNDMPHSRCVSNNCRVVCSETPYYGSFEDQIMSAISDVAFNCKNVALQLNEPTFRSGTVPENWLSAIHSNIRELTIIGGNIRHIPPYAFMSAFGNNLRTLVLEKIEISIWQYNTFLGLSNLERLHIIDCTLDTIDENALDAVDGSLKFLKISSSDYWNPINITGSSHSNKLSIVDFSSNTFEYNLQNASFSQIHNCEVLYLNSCNIKTIGTGTFDYLEKLEVLYLNNNYLVTIPVGLFDKILPLRPKIALQDNLWHCDCSVTDLRNLLIQNLLIVDPICRFPDAINGLAFSDFEGYCQKDADIESDLTEANNNSDKSFSHIQLCHNGSSTIYMNGGRDKNTSIKVIPYKKYTCHLNRIISTDLTPINYKVDRGMMSSSNDWIKPVYAVEKNFYSIVEIAASAEQGLGLLWFHSSCINEIYCVNTLPSTLKLYNMNFGIYYVFCPFNLTFGTILTEKCISYDLKNVGHVNIYSEKVFIIIIIISIGCLLGGAIIVYAVIHRNPSLLKGNKRVVFVKHKSIKALILPPQMSKRIKPESEPSAITKQVFEKQIFLLPETLNTLSPQDYLRSISMRSSDSNEAGYISPLHPTEEQLKEWRSNQIIKQRNDPVTLDSEALSSSCIYDRESLPYYYVPIHANEKNYEVSK